MSDTKPESPSRPGQRWLQAEGNRQQPETGPEPYITKGLVAERMDVEIRTVTRLMRRGVLRYYKVGPMVRFKWSEVESDMRDHFRVGCGGAACLGQAEVRRAARYAGSPKSENRNPKAISSERTQGA